MSEMTKCPICDYDSSSPERTVEGYTLERCSSCGMVFVKPRISNEEISTLYTQRDPSASISLYQKIAASPSIKLQHEQRLTLLKKLLPGKGRLLDFACGAGYFLEQAQRDGWDAHGSEIGKWAKSACESRSVAIQSDISNAA
jgi:hypothetical protein